MKKLFLIILVLIICNPYILFSQEDDKCIIIGVKRFKDLIEVRPNDNDIDRLWITIEKKNIDTLNKISIYDRNSFENLLLEENYYMHLAHAAYIWENILPYANKRFAKLLKKSYPNRLRVSGIAIKKYDKTVKCYKNLIYKNIFHNKFLMVLEKREKYNGAYIKVLIPIKDNRTHDFSSKDTIECKRIKYIFRD